MKRFALYLMLAIPALSFAQNPPIVQIQKNWVTSIDKRAALVSFRTQVSHNPWYGLIDDEPMLSSRTAISVRFFLAQDMRPYRLAKGGDYWHRFAKNGGYQ
jgi:hypothetical protein